MLFIYAGTMLIAALVRSVTYLAAYASVRDGTSVPHVLKDGDSLQESVIQSVPKVFTLPYFQMCVLLRTILIEILEQFMT